MKNLEVGEHKGCGRVLCPPRPSRIPILGRGYATCEAGRWKLVMGGKTRGTRLVGYRDLGWFEKYREFVIGRGMSIGYARIKSLISHIPSN